MSGRSIRRFDTLILYRQRQCSYRHTSSVNCDIPRDSFISRQHSFIFEDHMKPDGLFITGTDTDVGKTWVTSLIARELHKTQRVGVYKPACSGSEPNSQGEPTWPDVDALHASIGHQYSIDMICPQRFRDPLAPPVAARNESRTIDQQLLRTGCRSWDDKVDVLLVEGIGGLLCPVTDNENIADLVADIGYPLLIVARAGLGTINHTLMTIEVAQNRSLPIAGIVLNQCTPASDQATPTNPDEIANRTNVPVLGVVEYEAISLRTPDRTGTIDWRSLMHPPIEATT